MEYKEYSFNFYSSLQKVNLIRQRILVERDFLSDYYAHYYPEIAYLPIFSHSNKRI